jgi:hypothetical protein
VVYWIYTVVIIPIVTYAATVWWPRQTGKGIPTRALCQKDQGTVKIKQKPVTMADRTTHGKMSPERTPLQFGINK